MKRFINLLALSSMAVFLLTLIFSMISTHHATPYISKAKAACDLVEFSRIETEFQQMVQLRKQNPTVISDEAYKAAALAYIENSEFCYETTVTPGLQAQAEPVLIDNGGEWFPGYKPDEDELSGQYVAQGNKWGVPGLDNPGKTVTYSYMPQGVSHAVEGKDGNTHISNLNGFSSCFYTEIEVAFTAWSAVTNIEFIEITDNGFPSNASGAVGDIRIGAHSFDGSSGILAHAYYPPPNGTSIAGDLHFDSAESWRCTPSGGFDIGIVTMHEIGHSLGLEHEPMPSSGGNPALMNPYYNTSISGLLTDDINGITSIYGRLPNAGIDSDPFPILASTGSTTYTVFIRNNTIALLTNVLITNTIPGSTTYSSASNGGTETSPDTITWPSTTIPGNATISRTFTVTITETITDGDILINTLSATSDEAANIENQLLVSFVNPKLIYLPIIFR